ncbi:MAG: hypothetical protein ACTHVM_06000 [Alkalibacterium gilvum]|uniref:Uncharacterized protein n=1 Tax=Alkalibacterium gilvum TaxID=1130080 RepID=A0A1H6U1M8_9LACT|nr:hypothetical protein [Alkalibacterium gilvum]MDN6291054.1 hypothetical protein [Tetragenococcus koreensis]MDN6730535.1 hypothetical protein [Alkalibacterium sp.]SEI86258.1 hypothetical protein SAMN04488113_12633 [Alkalibacterium gilvum]
MIDLKYKTNLIVVILAALVSIAGWIVTGGFISGLYIGGGTFLTWALAREIDPKHEYSALLAAAISLINIFHYESISILIIAWLLLTLRMVNGLCGKPVTIFDMLLVLGLTTYLSFNSENSIYLIVFLLALALVSRGRKLTRTLVVINAIASILFLYQSFFLDYLSFNSFGSLNTQTVYSLILFGISFVLFWFLSKEDAVDDTGNKADRSRLLAGQVLYSASIILLVFFDAVSTNNLIIYVSVIIAITLYYIGVKIFKRN